MRKSFIISLLFMAVLLPRAIAEEPIETYHHSTLIMGVPQHLFQNGIRIEIDKKLNKPHKWLTIAPSFYHRSKRGNWLFGNYNIHRLSGAGLDVLYRHYIREEMLPKGIYISGGGGYRYISQEFRGERWDQYTENGLTFYRYNESAWHKNTQTFSLQGTAGYQTIIDKHLLLDCYMGVGIKYSDQSMPDDVVRYYATDAFDFGYSGFVFILGMRMGVGW